MAKYMMYSYKGYKNGKPLSGFQKAADVEELKERLSSQKIRLVSSKSMFSVNQEVKNKDIIRFAGQMHTMLANNISSAEAIEMFANYEKEDFKLILKRVLKNLNSGYALAESFQKTGCFSALFCETVAMGEKSSRLSEAFKNIMEFYENDRVIKKKVKSMASYPMVVIVLLIVATIAMSIAVIPKFQELYENAGGELPLISAIFSRFGKFLTSMCIPIAILSVLTVMGFKKYKKNPFNKKNLDRFYLDIPLTGTLYKKILVARFSNILALYLKSGIQLQDSLLSSAKILQNDSVYDEFLRGINILLSGRRFFEVVESISIFPPMYKQVVFTGERSGGLTESLIRLSNTMNQEATESLETIQAMVNQYIVVVLLALCLPLIAAVMLPIFGMTSLYS